MTPCQMYILHACAGKCMFPRRRGQTHWQRVWLQTCTHVHVVVYISMLDMFIKCSSKSMYMYTFHPLPFLKFSISNQTYYLYLHQFHSTWYIHVGMLRVCLCPNDHYMGPRPHGYCTAPPIVAGSPTFFTCWLARSQSLAYVCSSSASVRPCTSRYYCLKCDFGQFSINCNLIMCEYL